MTSGDSGDAALRRSDNEESTAVVYERVLRAAEEPQALAANDAYEIVDLLGKGGMGEVFRAVQRSLGREVALKQLAVNDPRAADYFLSEARVTARLAHANIVPVHTLSRAPDGRPMLAMKLVKGTAWSDLLRGEKAISDLSRHLEIFLAVTNAVAFAHAEGFLHRDLKPANVMVADYGQVFVLDWGLAVGLDRDLCDKSGILFVRDVTRPAGTPAYMAPELATGSGKEQGPTTDVYLLGACLYEVITGGTPHKGANPAEVLRHAEESPSPRFPPDAPRELCEIASRAMARDPKDRYSTVVELQAAVEAFVSHAAARTITQKGLSALERLRTLAREYAVGDAAAPSGSQSDSLQTGDLDEKAAKGHAIHRAYTEARFAFEHAIEIWPEGAEAREGQSAAARAMLEHALFDEDLPLATRLSVEVNDEELSRKTKALRDKVEAAARELVHLREQAHMLDDTRVARPLSNVFLVAAALGSAAFYPTKIVLERGKDVPVPITAIWSSVTVLCGGYALWVLKRTKRSLVSPRVGWTWAAVGIACLAAGAISMAQGEKPFRNAAYTTTMIAVGFAAMAMMTRKWLLIPAVTTLGGAVAMGFFPEQRVEIFGALWLLTLGGVGVALRRGARMDETDSRSSEVMR